MKSNGIMAILDDIVIDWILFSIGAYYLKKSYETITSHRGVDLFRTTGLLYFIGVLAYSYFYSSILEILKSWLTSPLQKNHRLGRFLI